MGGGSFLRFLIYALAIVTLVNYEKLCRKQLHIFAVYTCIGASLYASFSVNPHMAERFCTFFFSAILILIPHLRKCMRMPKPIFVFMLLFIFGFYIYTAHMSSSKEGQWAKYKNHCIIHIKPYSSSRTYELSAEIISAIVMTFTSPFIYQNK